MPEHTAQSFFPGGWSAPTTLATSTRTEPKLALGKSAQPVGSLAQAYSSSANISAWVPARLQPADRWLRLLGHHLLHSRPHPSGRVEDRDHVVDIFAEPVRRHAGEQSLPP